MIQKSVVPVIKTKAICFQDGREKKLRIRFLKILSEFSSLTGESGTEIGSGSFVVVSSTDSEVATWGYRANCKDLEGSIFMVFVIRY